MLAEFSIYPLGHSKHLSKDIAQIVRTLRTTGLRFQLGPISTAIEGDWRQVFDAIHECHRQMVETHERVVTTIIIDDSHTGHEHLDEMVKSVQRELAAQGHDAELEC